ncbi:DUF402 domain-containing protein [Actinokineospora sp.]|uniref:DUF402 domain-containing protein n=1 Tax=Actinokineospora sp. TaxID=1872133 RepID=UPI0040382173
MIFIPGQTIVRRYFRAEHITMVQACRVVGDDERGLLLWVPAGAGFACRWNPDGTRLREAPIELIAAAPLRTTHWRDTDVLILVRPGAAHSVWWFFTAGEFSGWYVNLESPNARWGAHGMAGVDTVDHALDIVVAPDRTWQWKDEDEFAESIGQPGYWSAGAGEEIRAEGERVVGEIEAGLFPFDGTWPDLRRTWSWSKPLMPDGNWAWGRQRAVPTSLAA